MRGHAVRESEVTEALMKLEDVIRTVVRYAVEKHSTENEVLVTGVRLGDLVVEAYQLILSDELTKAVELMPEVVRVPRPRPAPQPAPRPVPKPRPAAPGSVLGYLRLS
jgi:2-oxoglutarate dehydrogenase E2 component (dihydrolipoamide succinyltransferase)